MLFLFAYGIGSVIFIGRMLYGKRKQKPPRKRGTSTASAEGGVMKTIVTSSKGALIGLFNGGVYATIVLQALSAGVEAEKAHAVAFATVEALKNAKCYGSDAVGTAMMLSGKYDASLRHIVYSSQSGNEYRFQALGDENFLVVSYDDKKSSIAEELRKLHSPFFAEGLELPFEVPGSAPAPAPAEDIRGKGKTRRRSKR
ncbi:MAG: hypothetical protein HGA33_00560 [Candidatus Moranbacteria bacterium]|nr:hypothetical protein [Candidatus Moranbacteria bacterium]